MSDWTIDTLRELVYREFELREIALRLAVKEVDERLAILNKAYTEARTKEADFFGRREHEQFTQRLDERLTAMQRDLADLSKPDYILWGMMATLLMTLASDVWKVFH